MNQKGGTTNYKDCFHDCSAWPGILVHLALESAFTFAGIRICRGSVEFLDQSDR